jgi:hypothetical protein
MEIFVLHKVLKLISLHLETKANVCEWCNIFVNNSNSMNQANRHQGSVATVYIPAKFRFHPYIIVWFIIISLGPPLRESHPT